MNTIYYWPPVYPSEYSEISCSYGSDTIRWLCLGNGSFDGNSPDYSECYNENWISDLLNQNISSIEDVKKFLKKIDYKTEKDESLNNTKTVENLIIIFAKLQNFLRTYDIKLEAIEAFTMMEYFLKSFSNLIIQNDAWNGAENLQKEKAASKILLLIQNAAFSLSKYFDSENGSKSFETKIIKEYQREDLFY